MKNYVDIPQSISIDDIKQNNYILSSNSYKRLIMKNANYKKLGDLLDRKLTRQDLGQEVGSLSYITNSLYYFMRSKALQNYSFLPQITKETTLPILPQSFVNLNLKKGDLIISKDSNIGEVAILDKDYPNTMLSGALYKLPITKNKFYIFALMKHEIFTQQLDFMVPKGATIRHAKTLFLDCKIPFPNYNAEKTLKFIETITKSIIAKEMRIKELHAKILESIEKELLENQKPNKFIYTLPNINEIKASTRLDTGIYCEEFKRWNFVVTNYKYGYKNLIDRGFDYARGTSLEKNFLGTRIDSNTFIEGFYELLIPTNITEYGTITKTSFIGTKTKLKTIQKGDIIFGGEATFKSCVVVENTTNIATNYHGIRLINKNNNLNESIFVRCFIEFWRNKGMIQYISVGGQGGHCAPSYFHLIETPLFPQNKQNEIASLYHNPNAKLEFADLNLENFAQKDNEFCQKAGIYELDKSIKHLKKILNNTIDDIVNDKASNLAFDLKNTP